MMICDSEGVPCLVQKLEYRYGNFMVTVRYFDGQVLFMEPPVEVGITDSCLTPIQWVACQRDAEEGWAPEC